MASRNVENIFESAPSGEDGELVVEFGLFVEPFEYRRVGVGAEFVGIDLRIGGAGEHFVVAGIGKGHAVGDASDAAFGLVADDLALLRDDSPKKREQSFAAVVDVVAPEFALQAFGPTPDSAVFGIEKRRIGTGENFLPAEAVNDDEDDVARLELGLCGEKGCEEQDRDGEDCSEGKSASVHDGSFLFK